MRGRALVVLLALASLLAVISPSLERAPSPSAPPPSGPSPAGPSPAGPSPSGPSPAGPSPSGPSPYPLPAGEREERSGTVVRTVDGDTIYVRLARGVEKVRYIGLDTPEAHHP